MDTQPSLHPTSEILRAYGLGKLDAASAEAVYRHLEDCPDCRRQVAEMAPDSFLGRLRDAQAVSPPATKVDDDLTLDPPTPGPSPKVSDDTHDVDPDNSTEPSLRPGSLIRYFGDYELQRLLGEGGMGIVYKARQLSLNRAVALKMIRALRFPSADEVHRFQNEAEAVARLDHPNIVPIFEVGRFEDQHYFSMKLIAGTSLDKRLKDYATDPRRAAQLMAVVAEAIHHAHQRGILHRDLKPANILVDADEHPHVTDFGLAKRVEGDSELTRSGAIVGTPAYMAPEQASAKKGTVTTATDVHGLGAILYALLTARAPFGGTTVLDTLEQVRERPPDSPRKLNPRVPRDLEVICLKCLEKDPRRRYARADALAGDLKRWLAGEPIAARPVGNAARFWMWCRRNPVVAGASGMTAAALVVVAVVSLLYARQQTHLATARKLFADEQTDRADEQTRYANEQARARSEITALAKNLEREGQNLKISLADSNRRLAMLYFERAQRAFDGDDVNIGLLWLVESWRSAAKAGDPSWQRLARANLSFWWYHGPKVEGVYSHCATVSKVASSPDGKVILTGSWDKTSRLWNADTTEPIGEPMVHKDVVWSVAFSPDGKTIVTGSWDNTARLWNAATGRPIGSPLRHRDWVRSVAFSPDGKTMLTGSADNTAQLWDAATGQPIGQPLIHQGPVWFVAYGPSSKTLLTGSADSTARLWDAATSQPIGQPLIHKAVVTDVAYSPDGKTVLTGSADSTARLWDAATGQPIGQPMIHQGRIASVKYSPNGRTLLTGSADSTARLWDAATGQPIGQPMIHKAVVTGVAYSPDGRTVLTGSADSTARLWDAATGQPIGQPMIHKAVVTGVAYSPDGRTVLTGSADSTARLWDAATGQPIGQPMIHQGRIMSVMYSPDGKFILTGSGDGKARRWHLPPELRDDLSQAKAEVEVSTRLAVDDDGNLHRLDSAALRERFERLGRTYPPSRPTSPPTPSTRAPTWYFDLMPAGVRN